MVSGESIVVVERAAVDHVIGERGVDTEGSGQYGGLAVDKHAVGR